MQSIAEIFPLTYLTASARAIMINSTELADISYHLTILVAQIIMFTLFGNWFLK